jgi:large subunit ribosomal protein L21
MNTIFEKGDQIDTFSLKPGQIFRIDYQKKVKTGDIIKVDRVLKHGEEYGQFYLKGIIVHLEVMGEGLDEKITIVKYNAKKRYKVKKGYRARFTEVRIAKIEDQRQPKNEPESKKV